MKSMNNTQIQNLKDINRKVIVQVREGQKHIDISEHLVEDQRSDDVLLNVNENDLTCITCHMNFGSESFLRDMHFKSPWHIFNIKLRAKGIATITEQEYSDSYSNFDGDFDDLFDESDDEVVILKGSSKIDFFTEDLKKYSVWKNVVSPIANTKVVTADQYIDSLYSLSRRNKWVILMSLGGNFAGGVYDNGKCTKHKSFHRYTVRKKQGGSQVSRDNRSATSAPKSVGSSIRRLQTKMFIEQIQKTLILWKDDIDTSDLIFIYAPSHNWANFFDLENPMLDKDDDRIRSIPFTCRKPNFEEVKNCYSKLSTVEISEYDPEEIVEDTISTPKSLKIEVIQNDTIELPQKTIVDAIKEGNTDLFIQLFNEDGPKVGLLYIALKHNKHKEILSYLIDLNYIEDINYQNPDDLVTPLHIAYAKNLKDVIDYLLLNGADPTILDIHNLPPHRHCNNANTKKQLRVFAGENVDLHDWESIDIIPITPEEVIAFNKKQKEKNKEKRKRKQERQKQNKEEQLLKKQAQEKEQELVLLQQEAEKERLNKVSKMSDREKRALAAEQRFAKQRGEALICEFCHNEIQGIPFERLNFKYCSTTCVIDHRKTL